MTPEQARVAQSDPNDLKRWLQTTGRKYVVFNAIDLVDALSWPEGAQAFQGVIEAYRAHRQTKDTGKTEVQRTLDGVEIPVTVTKGEVLELDEKKELWTQLGEELGL